MAKFEVTYTATITRSYVVVVNAQDADDAEIKLLSRLDKGSLPGDLEDEEVECEVEDVEEIDD